MIERDDFYSNQFHHYMNKMKRAIDNIRNVDYNADNTKILLSLLSNQRYAELHVTEDLKTKPNSN